MKKNCNIGRIFGLALMLILGFSGIVFSEEFIHTQFLGKINSRNMEMFYNGTDYITFKAYSFEVDVIETKVSTAERATFADPINMISIGISAECSNCGLYIKITSPDGKVIFDRSTPEKGFVKLGEQINPWPIDPVTNEIYNIIPGKYTVWIKPSGPNVIERIGITIGGVPVQ